MAEEASAVAVAAAEVASAAVEAASAVEEVASAVAVAEAEVASAVAAAVVVSEVEDKRCFPISFSLHQINRLNNKKNYLLNELWKINKRLDRQFIPYCQL